MKNLHPIGPQILLRFLPDAPLKEGDIFLGHNVDKGPKRAEVIAFGRGARAKNGTFIPFEVRVGDVVLVDRYTNGVELKEDGESYCVVREKGLLGILEG